MEEEIYHAELADVKRETNILNGLAGTTVAVAIVFLMLGISLGEIAEKNSARNGKFVVLNSRGRRSKKVHFSYQKNHFRGSHNYKSPRVLGLGGLGGNI